MFKRDRSEVMPGQMEKLIEAAVASLEMPDGAGSDLEEIDAYDIRQDYSTHPFVELHGNVDLPQLIREIVAEWEQVRLP